MYFLHYRCQISKVWWNLDRGGWKLTVVTIEANKKVLLRERKRHTNRGVSSTPYVSQSGVPPGQVWLGGGGTRGGVPPRRGTTPARSDRGGVTQGGVPPAGYPHGQVWQGVPEVGYPRQGYPWLDLAGVSPGWTWPGYPPVTDGWMDGQTRVKTLPSRRTTYAVGKYS